MTKLARQPKQEAAIGGRILRETRPPATPMEWPQKPYLKRKKHDLVKPFNEVTCTVVQDHQCCLWPVLTSLCSNNGITNFNFSADEFT
uniref:Uncharacterized protein n=1 Tax=Romanomermis culicivorax TaxID=13658 RepID=A0A915KXT6_ROMCU